MTFGWLFLFCLAAPPLLAGLPVAIWFALVAGGIWPVIFGIPIIIFWVLLLVSQARGVKRLFRFLKGKTEERLLLITIAILGLAAGAYIPVLGRAVEYPGHMQTGTVGVLIAVVCALLLFRACRAAGKVPLRPGRALRVQAPPLLQRFLACTLLPPILVLVLMYIQAILVQHGFTWPSLTVRAAREAFLSIVLIYVFTVIPSFVSWLIVETWLRLRRDRWLLGTVCLGTVAGIISGSGIGYLVLGPAEVPVFLLPGAATGAVMGFILDHLAPWDEPPAQGQDTPRDPQPAGLGAH